MSLPLAFRQSWNALDWLMQESAATGCAKAAGPPVLCSWPLCSCTTVLGPMMESTALCATADPVPNAKPWAMVLPMPASIPPPPDWLWCVAGAGAWCTGAGGGACRATGRAAGREERWRGMVAGQLGFQRARSLVAMAVAGRECFAMDCSERRKTRSSCVVGRWRTEDVPEPSSS